MSKKIHVPAIGVVLLACGYFWATSGEKEPATQTFGLEVEGLQDSGPAGELPSAKIIEVPPGAEPKTKGTREALPEVKVEPLQLDRGLSAGEWKSARWIEGTVIFPEGTPVDESLEVIAKGGVFEGSKPERRIHRVPVDPGGFFRVAVAKDTEKARLRIEGTYCYFVDEFVWRSTDEGPIELSPKLGIAVDVMVTTAFGGQTPFKDFHASIQVFSDFMGDESPELLEGNVLQLKALPPAGGLLTVNARGMAVHSEPLLTGDEYGIMDQLAENDATSGELEFWQPGTRQSITIKMQAEARIEGLLSDDRGQPVLAGLVEVHRVLPDPDALFGDRMISAEIRDGRFSVGTLEPGDYRASFAGFGLLFEDKLVPNLRLGEVREVIMTGKRGLAISGRVTWESGEPAIDVEVKLMGREQSGLGEKSGPPGRVLTDADGKFEFTGFTDVEAFGLMACGVPPGLQPPQGESKLKKRRWIKENELLALIEGVRPGGPPVELGLGLNSAKLVGRVVNDKGEPVQHFRISATPRFGLKSEISEVAQRNSFSDASGEFELSKLTWGNWSIEASALGHRSTRPQIVELPVSGPLLFTLPRKSSISGRVVNSAGEVVRSWVRLEWLGPETCGVEVMERTKKLFSSKGKGTGFEASNLDAGIWQLKAGDLWGGYSVPLKIDLAPGEQRTAVILTLPAPGRLEGTVHPDWLAGELSVHLAGSEGYSVASATVSGDGRFAFDQVPPDTYTATVKRCIERGEGDFPIGLSSEVTVQSGATAVLRFGGIPAGSIQLSGRLLQSKKSLPGYNLEFVVEGWGDLMGAFTDSDGRYEVVLPGPGEYIVLAQEDGVAASQRSWVQPIAGSGKQTLDLELPANKLLVKFQLESGGVPAVQQRVSFLYLEPAWGGSSFEGKRDGDGQILFGGLSAGKHEVTFSNYGLEGQLIVLGPLTVTVEEGPESQELILTLGEGCTLSGQVLGGPEAERQWVYLYRSETGDDYADLTGASDGSFRFEDLPAGEYWLACETDGRTSPRVHVVLERGADISTDVRF